MQEVTTIRPANLSITPLFQSALSEGPVSLYRMKITSQSADARRASFVWRAPSSRLLLNPLIYYECEFDVTIPHKFSKLYNSASVQQPVDSYTTGGTGQDHQSEYTVLAANNNQMGGTRLAGSDGSCITFGEGNCVCNSIESIQVSLNGMSISHNNWHLFKRSLDRTNIPSDVAQRCFARCGGAWNRYDEVCTSAALAQKTSRDTGVNMTSHAAAGGCTQTAGMTCDSGTAQRSRNFADSVVSVEGEGVDKILYNNAYVYRVKLLAPLDGAVFNQVYGEANLSASGVYPKLCLAIPNANSCAITILWKDLEKQLVRRLGRTFLGVAADNNAIQRGSERTTSPFSVKFVGTESYLHVKYLRMQSFRSYPEAVSLACYRQQAYIQDMTVSGDVVKLDTGAVKYSKEFSGPYLMPSGPDIRPAVDGNQQIAMRGAAYGYANEKRVWQCEFQNCVFSQPPSTLFFVAQKSMECTQFDSPSSVVVIDALALNDAGGPIDGDVIADTNTATAAAQIKSHYRSVIQNQDSNLAIIRFKLLIQSSVASWEMSSDNFPYLLDAQQMFDTHKKNCCTDYMKRSGIDEWQRRACCLKLSTSDYLQGLGASFGTAFPITISCTLVFQNRSAFSSGLKYSDVRSPGPILFQEPIHARAVMVGIFDRQIAQLSSASGVLSAQNFTAATAQAVLSRRT